MLCHHLIQLKTGLVVPCGKCPACLANQRQEWVFRLKQEFVASKFAIFVTLTYNDEHVPEDFSVNKKDVQDFHKRLRKHFSSGIMRYYVVSEYGDRTQRPHYHGLYFFSEDVDQRLVYDAFEKSWQLGFLKFGEVEEGSIVYCTKYCLKHSSTPLGRKPTFRLVSKMSGGLGYNYLQKMSEYHIENDNYTWVSYNGQRCRMPRYYKDKLQVVNKFLTEDQRSEQLQDYYSELKQKHYERFTEWLKTHKGLSFEEAILQFNEHEKVSHDVRDELIIKHTKKQKF